MTQASALPLEKDHFRRLILRGLSHDYKRILLSLTKRASDFRKNSDAADIIAIADTYKYFTDAAITITKQLDTIGNEIYRETTVPATSILARHNSALEKNIDLLVQTAERYTFILSLHAKRPALIDDGEMVDLVDQAKRARRQIQALLVLPFKESELKLQRLNVRNEVRRITSDLYALFSEHKCDPEKTVTIETDLTLRTDQTLFSIAVSNLIANAVVHSERGPELAIRVFELNSTTEHDQTFLEHAKIVVADNGLGIPKDERCEIFQMFNQGKHKKEKGSGVGLTFARLAMDLVGGSLTLIDSAEQGAAFLLRFPIRQ